MPKPPSMLSVSLADREVLKQIADSESVPPSVANHARILLLKTRGMSNEEIGSQLNVSANTVKLWVKRYREREPGCDLLKLLSIGEGRGRKKDFSDEDIAWLKAMNEGRDETGEATTEFTRRIQEEADGAGHSRMSKVSRTSVRRILGEK